MNPPQLMLSRIPASFGRRKVSRYTTSLANGATFSVEFQYKPLGSRFILMLDRTALLKIRALSSAIGELVSAHPKGAPG
jgi:hypothetical protein